MSIAGHCFDIDGNYWHPPGECPGASANCDGRCCRRELDVRTGDAVSMDLPAGTVVTLDEIDAVTGTQWIGYLLTPTPPMVAVRVWRGRLDVRAEFTYTQILDERCPTAHELAAVAGDIAASITREKTTARQLRAAQIAARLAELATLHRQADLDTTRERQRDQVAAFNEAFERRRAEWAAHRKANA